MKRIERCFPEPISSRLNIPLPRQPREQPAPIRLNFDAQNQCLLEAPTISQRARREQLNSCAYIWTPGGHGSGFIVEADKPVVVTAAHVVLGEDIDSIRVISASGQSVGVERIGYIYEKGSKLARFKALRRSRVVDIDLAILRPKQPMADTIPLADTVPERGSWVTCINYQGNRHPASSDPAYFNALVTTERPHFLEPRLVTGVEPWRREQGEDDTAVPGCSGGLLIDGTGRVVGLTHAIDLGPTYETEQDYAVTFGAQAGLDTGILPTGAHFVGVDALSLALRSGNY